MTNNPITEQEAALRLHQALTAVDPLTPEQAQALLPALVEAEHAGVDVDSDPTFAALLQHLDHNEESMALYLELSEDLELALDPAADLPAAPVPPTFFSTPVRDSGKVVLHLLPGLRRRFELTLAMPNLAPRVATLGSGGSGDQPRREHLFSSTLDEIAGKPLLAVSLHITAGVAELLVAVRDATPTTRWQVNLSLGDRSQTAQTDAQGVARFANLPVSDLQQVPDLRLTCAEVR